MFAEKIKKEKVDHLFCLFVSWRTHCETKGLLDFFYTFCLN